MFVGSSRTIGSYILSVGNKISGFTIARNVVKFEYPFEQWCQAMVNLNLAEIVVGYDPTTEDGTHELMLKCRDRYGIRLFESVWDMNNFERGTELGIQTDKVMEQLNYDWNLYVQLDEAFHEDDALLIHEATKQPPQVTGVDFLRVYFFGNLQTIRKDWSVKITRLTRKGTHSYADFDGMNCKPLQGVHSYCSAWLYHYSRLGDPKIISQRIRNVDGFFHQPKHLVKPENLSDYDFKTREFDNTSVVESEKPREVPADFKIHHGTHPLPFAELYKEYK